jgi:hypothetical protein
MRLSLPRGGRHRLVRPQRLLAVAAAVVVIGLTLVVVVNAGTPARPATVRRTLTTVENEATDPGNPTVDGNWAPDVQYPVGAQATYDGVAYRCRQAHRSQLTWEPPNTPALWQRL